VEDRADVGARQGRANVLRTLGRSGPMHRTELARTLGVSPATITEVTRELLDLGLVRTVGKRPSRGGRPAELLALVSDSALLLGVKVAPDHVSGVLVDLAGTVVDSFEVPFDARSPNLVGALESVLTDHLAEDRLLGVGLGVPGMVARADGGRVTAPTLGWVDLDLGSRLQERLGLPVIVENDVHTLAVAERLFGRGADVDDFVTITLGEGVGLGVVIGGELHTGARGGAAEIGHVIVDESGPRCGCGRHGCLEAFASDPALVGRAVEEGILPTDGSIEELRAVPEAAAIFARAGTHLGRTVATVVTILAPQMILVSGEGVASWPLLRQSFETAFRAGVLPAHADVPVVMGRWDDLDWARGAASLLARTIFAPSTSDGAVERLVRSRLAATAQLRIAADGR